MGGGGGAGRFGQMPERWRGVQTWLRVDWGHHET